MARYIDAAEPIRKIMKLIEKVERCSAEHCAYAEAIVQIERTPTADVVEVVRCGNCKYYTLEDCRCDHPEMYGEDCYDFWLNTNEDDFCSYGERRTDNDL